MLSFKSFVNAIQEAIVSASDALMNKNVSLLDKYFIETTDTSGPEPKTTLQPKTVILKYPHLNNEGVIENLDVAVPLVTLVPLSMSQLEKAVLKADFEMDVVNGEVQLHFSHKDSGGFFEKKHKTSLGNIEITFRPQETSEGFKMLVEGYEAILKRQIS